MLFSIYRDGQIPAVVLGLLLHLIVIYGITNKPFSHVSSGTCFLYAFDPHGVFFVVVHCMLLCEEIICCSLFTQLQTKVVDFMWLQG